MLSSGAREAGVGGDRPQRRADERIGRVLSFDRARRQDEWRQPSTPNGELFTKTDSETGEVWTYHYDALGDLLSVDLPDGRLIEYVIDGQNRRIGKRIDGVLTRAWLYKDQLKPIAELDGSGNLVARFIYGSKTNVPDVILRYAGATVTRYRVISDHLGSPVMAVNVDNPAEVPFAAEYSAFGEMTLTSGASSNDWMPFGFAGGLYDADTELVRFGARDYDAVSGRWTAKDPTRWAGAQANLYGYVGDDPVNRRDPSGLFTTPWDIKDIATELSLDFPGPVGGQQDAMRHCLASCMMTQEYGEKAAAAFGLGNETWGDICGQDKANRDMDDNNNIAGIYFGNAGGNCITQCTEGLSSGLLITNAGPTGMYN